MKKTVILTEKPSVARDIANVLGVTQKRNGYIENEQYQITWAFGHLVELAEPAFYDEKYKAWNLEQLPIFPTPFQLVLKKDSGARKQYKVIKNLFINADNIINATDAGREGELIFRYIYNLSKANKPTKRLWISSMTNQAIKQGFDNLKNGKDYDNLFHAAHARSISDWVIGLNITRAFTVANKSSKALSLGRVQTPILYMIIKRFLDNKNFTPIDYFLPQLKMSYDAIDFVANFKSTNKLTLEQASNIIFEIKEKTVVLDKTEDKEKETKAPFLLDLTTLQQVCNIKYSYSADKTLKVLQGLYEKHKIVSYPRTDSNRLTDDMVSTVENTLKILANLNSPISKAIDTTTVNPQDKRVFNADKVSDHHAIIPTENTSLKSIYSTLNVDEKNVFNTVTDYFIKIFLPNYKYRSLIYTFSVNNHIFISSGNTPISQGWKLSLFDATELEKEKEEILPNLPEDFNTDSYDTISIKKTTKAPALLNEASLLKYMDNVHTFFKEEDLTNIKKSGIGTPATRAGTIETLKKRTYIKLKGKHLLPTELGLLVFKHIKNEPISSPKITSKMESYLDSINSGDVDIQDVILKIKSFTELVIKSLIKNADSTSFNALLNPKTEIGVKCPKCNTGDIKESKKAFYCSNFKNEDKKCDFTIWKNIASKNITANIAKTLIQNKTTKEIKGFKSKSKKSFSAKLKLGNNFKVSFEFNTKK